MVLARLDDRHAAEKTDDALVQEALQTSGAYVETYRRVDLLPDQERALLYSYRVTDAAGAAIGVLCLCFRFENEMERIFANLATPEDWSVVMLLDAEGGVIASSDAFHIPVGARVEPVLDAEYRIVRFAGREYLAASRRTHGYQGYMGPGWIGHVMLPVQHAFNKDASEMLRDIAPEALAAVMESPALFGTALRNIPLQADRIQRDLNRSVWNGNVRQSSDKRAINPAFSKILLWEISNTGARTKDVFARSIDNLHETVVSAILQDTRFLASLAIDIMDRNLYERANDCRWWALTSAFRELLAQEKLGIDDPARIAAILQTINGLYTVYTNLLVFDSRGRVVAVSQPSESFWVGRQINEDWARRVLGLDNSQGYIVSDFAPTQLYGGRSTYIYGAAIRSPDNTKVAGGVGIIFDSAPQFAAMLQDALPRGEFGQVQAGSFGAFTDRSGQVISSTNEHYAPGQTLEVPLAFLALSKGEARTGIVRLAGQYYALGARASSGYREFKGDQDAYRNDVIALVFIPLCEAGVLVRTAGLPRLPIRSDRGSEDETVELATFHVGQTWFGLRSERVVEAVDCVGMTRVPGAGKDFAGYLMYRGTPIPVFDIRTIANAGAPAENAERQVVVLRKGENGHFGILADGLGDIPEVSLARVQPLPSMLVGGNVLAEAVLGTEAPGDKQLLVVLSADRIAARLLQAYTELEAPLPALEVLPTNAPTVLEQSK